MARDPRSVIAAQICPGQPLDFGIVRAVQVLINAGVETFESCEGGPGHAWERPTVRFHGSPAAGWHALAVCLDHRLPVASLARRWPIEHGEPVGPEWVLTFTRKVD